MKKQTLIAPLLAVMLLLCAAGPAPAADTIKIGFVGDFSNVYSFYDVPLRDGARLAVEEINAAGGVLGKKLELVVRDGRNDQGASVRMTEELIRDGAIYMIPTTGDPAVAQGLIACQHKVPVSTGDGTAPTLVGDMGPCAMQWCISDNVQGAVSAQFAYEKGFRKIFMVLSTEIPYTKNLPQYFKKAFEKLGGTIIGEEQYRIDSGDYSAQVTKIANLKEKPDAIFTPMFLPTPPFFCASSGPPAWIFR